MGQKKKNVCALHSAIKKTFPGKRSLEISTKSDLELGIKMSAFNLIITAPKSGKSFSVECAFQASKVFEYGGPYTDLLDATPKEAKTDKRLRESGKLQHFRYFSRKIPNNPRTLFYDWLYINALLNSDLDIDEICTYDAFTDIEFNPKKSLNCQAFSAALFVSLRSQGIIKKKSIMPDKFYELTKNFYNTFKNCYTSQSLLPY